MQREFEFGEWIWDTEEQKNSYYIFQDVFNAERAGSDFMLFLSADTQYALYLNGSFVDCGQYAAYEEYKVYDAIPLSQGVAAGKNVLELVVYYQGEDSFSWRNQRAGLLYELEHDGRVIAFSSPAVCCKKIEGYKDETVGRITPQLSFSFAYDANCANQIIRKSACVGGKAKLLNSRPICKLQIGTCCKSEFITQGIFLETRRENSTMGERMQNSLLGFREIESMLCEKSSSVCILPNSQGISLHGDISETGDGLYLVLDFGKTTTGLLFLDLETEISCEVLIGWGEHLTDLRVRTAIEGRSFAASYTAKPGRQQFLYPFKRVEGRYLQLHFYSDRCRIFSAGICSVSYPVSDSPYFRCNDRLHNKIYEVCVETLKNCMHEHYEDCPWREQALYTMDSRNQMLCGYYTFGEYTFARESLRLIALSLRQDDMLELCSPSKIKITIPSFTAVFVLQLYEYLLYSGDTEFVKETLPVAERIIDGFLSHMDSDIGLVPSYSEKQYWNFYEWENGLDGGEPFKREESQRTFDAPLNLFVLIAINSYLQICEQLNFKEKAQKYFSLPDLLGANINARFWSEAHRAYATYSDAKAPYHYCELTQALAAYSGITGEKTDAVLQNLISGKLIPITLSYSIFKYEALLQRPEQYAKWVFQDIADIWGKMLFHGATTFWETAKGEADFHRAGSLCHGWSAVPAYLYHAYVMGIRPVQAGFEDYQVNPVVCEIGEAECRILTPGGEITRRLQS